MSADVRTIAALTGARCAISASALATFMLGSPMSVHAATSPQPPRASAIQAQGPARLELVPAAQRAALPDSALVTLFTGRTATMGQVRQEHNRRLQRFANARLLGDAWLHKIPLNQNPGNQGSNKGPLAMPAVQNAAKDYMDFCTAAQATACVYFPANESYLNYPPFGGLSPIPLVFDFDPLITDSAVCSAGGGNLLQNNQGCAYGYPTVVTPNFAPGSYATPATGGCSNSVFSNTYDPHGAVQVKYTGSVPIVTTNTDLVCIVRVIPN